MDGFSEFLQFSMKLFEAGRVLVPVTMQVGVGDSRQDFDLKISPKISLFWCLVTAGGLVLPKSGSVRFFAIFAEPRTGPMVRFKQLAEL